MVECEFAVRFIALIVNMVLIDTWWNVNKSDLAISIA